MKKLLLILFTFSAQNSFAFDLEDYATTYRATSDAHKKAHVELRLAEDTFFALLKTHRALLPMPTATIANMGSKLGSCSYLKECSEAYTRSKILTELNAVLADSKIQTVINADNRGALLSATQKYYDDFNADIPKNQKILLEEQSADIVYNEDVNTVGFSRNGT